LVLDEPERLKRRIGAGDIIEIRLQNGADQSRQDVLAHVPPNYGSVRYEADVLQIANVTTLDALPALLSALERARLRVEDLIVRKVTLEDVFIDLTGRTLRE
jgi:ABC-2 type transport system ATP-binding protein